MSIHIRLTNRTVYTQTQEEVIFTIINILTRIHKLETYILWDVTSVFIENPIDSRVENEQEVKAESWVFRLDWQTEQCKQTEEEVIDKDISIWTRIHKLE